MVCSAALLAACGGSQPPIGAPDAMDRQVPNAHRPHRHLDFEAR
jgi:hypothetical protein